MDIRSLVSNYAELTVNNFFFDNISCSTVGGKGTGLSGGGTFDVTVRGSQTAKITGYNASTGVVSFTFTATGSGSYIYVNNYDSTHSGTFGVTATLTADLCCFR